MTTTPNRYDYWIQAVIAGVGWVTDHERDTVAAALGADAIVFFNQSAQQINLAWPLTGDTMNDAIDDARATLRKATEATGVTSPRLIAFEIREIGR